MNIIKNSVKTFVFNVHPLINERHQPSKNEQPKGMIARNGIHMNAESGDQFTNQI